MQGDRRSYQRAAAWEDAAQREEVELSFKRFILNRAMAFEREPMADLYRVGLLAQMLDRYDALREQGLSRENALRRTEYEFRDIPDRMREQGFDEAASPHRTAAASRWPQLTEEEAAQYIRESNEYFHHQAIGTALCSACVAPLMAAMALSDLFGGFSDTFGMLGMVGLFGMIGLGIYAMTTAVKPKKKDQIRKGHFSLSNRLRRKLVDLQELTEQKARRRRGKGMALLVTCVMPMFLGVGLAGLGGGNFWPLLGMTGLFLMIGGGVYEFMMGDAEKKVLRRLLGKAKDERDS